MTVLDIGDRKRPDYVPDFVIDRNFWRTYWVVYEVTWCGEVPHAWFRSYAMSCQFKALLEQEYGQSKEG